jgi:hypothetical protein
VAVGRDIRRQPAGPPPVPISVEGSESVSPLDRALVCVLARRAVAELQDVAFRAERRRIGGGLRRLLSRRSIHPQPPARRRRDHKKRQTRRTRRPTGSDASRLFDPRQRCQAKLTLARRPSGAGASASRACLNVEPFRLARPRRQEPPPDRTFRTSALSVSAQRHEIRGCILGQSEPGS